jgi:hypothetical protein
MPDRAVNDLGPVYGQWRHGAEYIDKATDYSGFGVDQILNVIDGIKSDHSRRHVLSALAGVGPGAMALPRTLAVQFYVRDRELSMHQRSGTWPWATLYRQLRHADVRSPRSAIALRRLSIKMGLSSTYALHVRDQCQLTPSIPYVARTRRSRTSMTSSRLHRGLCAASGNRHVDVLTRLFPPYSRLRDSLMHLCKCSTIGWASVTSAVHVDNGVGYGPWVSLAYDSLPTNSTSEVEFDSVICNSDTMLHAISSNDRHSRTPHAHGTPTATAVCGLTPVQQRRSW